MPREATILREGAEDAVGIERRPGEFARHVKTGAPYVTDPARLTDAGLKKAELVELCARHDIAFDPKATVPQLKALLGDLAKRGSKVMYGRPSSLGKQIENTTNLQKWSERMVSLGIARDAELAADAAALVGMDETSKEFKDAADAIARRAKTVAQAHLAAERGTHHHELTEDVDTDRDPVARMVAGEDLGVPAEVQQALITAWQKMLVEYDLEILTVEATCVDDIWRQAGTLDRIARLRKDLRFIQPTGEIVVIPAGTVLILDIKTGKLRLDDAGFVSYWRSYAVQLASYAQSVPYDPDTDTRSTWEEVLGAHS